MTAENFKVPIRGAYCPRVWWLLVAIMFGASSAFAQPAGPIISAIRIEGNQRVESDAIRIHVASQIGQPLNEATVDTDIKSIYRMGFFDRVAAETRAENGRTILIYKVAERPLLTDVRLSGMKKIKPTEDSVINAVKLHAGEVLDPSRVETTIRGLKGIYEDKGYLDAKITFKTTPEANNTAIGEFDVAEGPIISISKVDFVGNHHFSPRRLRGIIAT
ncbi:MAG: POTRA domain-containing protein, partial [Candidatus Binataceae bacterium]